MSPPTSSVLIVSYRRPHYLATCLTALVRQEVPPTEVVVVWQADDVPTRATAEAHAGALACPLRVVHSPEAGVVAAENAGLDAAVGEVILLIDDDAIAPPDWVARHLAHYADPTVGAVGGPADNYEADGARLPIRAVEPVGKLTWYGRIVGNMYDHVPEWRARPPREVDHLVGYNMSLRRAAFDRFEAGLRRYWQMFELEACLQVRAAGYRVLFDFANVVEHHPTNTAYIPGRGGDPVVKVDNPAYNAAFILARHSPARLRPWRLLYLLGVGSTRSPGLLALPLAVRRHGHPLRELGLMLRAWRHTLAGWSAGARARRASRAAPAPARDVVLSGQD